MKTCGTCTGYEHGPVPCAQHGIEKENTRAETCPLYYEYFENSSWKIIAGLKIDDKDYGYGYKCRRCSMISLTPKLTCPHCYSKMTNGEEE